MTRFARAHGSKSSNVREPEEATSWSQMRRGIQNQVGKTRMRNPEDEDDDQEEMTSLGNNQ